MALVDAGARFWLRYIEDRGGLWEDAGESTIVVLPEPLQEQYRHTDELRVTTDPDVAREDGASLLFAGHPWLMQAAESVLEEGDCGVFRLPRPAGPPPDSEHLLAKAREQFPVDHGRIDAAGGATPGLRPVLRFGALVTFAVSSDVNFQEQADCWVDIPSCLELADEVVARLSRLVEIDHRERAMPPPPAADLLAAARHAHQRIDVRAGEREADLSKQVDDDHGREVERAVAYYDEAVRSLQRRLDAAPPERTATLAAKIASTHAERDRRLGEIAEKYRATRRIRPFRLHALGVPTLRLPVDIRRGERRFPLSLDWLLSARTFAPVRCPACGRTAPLVAAKSGLGCRDCLIRPAPSPSAAPVPPAPASAAPVPPASASPAAVPPAPTSPAPTSPAPTSPAPTSPAAASPAAASPAAASPAAVPPGSLATPVTAPAPALPRRVARSSAATEYPDVTPRRSPSPQAIQKAGRKLVASLWDLTAAGDRRVQRLYAPHSPANAMHALFGSAAALRTVGLDPGEQPLATSSSDSRPAEPGGDMLLIDGELRTAGMGYGYQLCWRFTAGAALVEELTPFEGAFWPRQPEPRYHPAGRRLYERTLPRRVELDPVANVLWQHSMAGHGLPLTLRALAAWWRLDERERLLAEHPVRALAAAVDRMIAYRSGVGGHYDETATAYRVAVAEVRAAGAQLQRQLRLSPIRPW